MMQEIKNSLEALYRRVLLVVAPARITFVNDGGNVQLVQVKLDANQTKDNTPRLCEFGFSSNPPPGSDAVVLMVNGDRTNGVVVATGNQASRPKGLASGESILYDAFGKSVWLKADGTMVIEANGGDVILNGAKVVTVRASEKVRLETPLLEVTGDIIDNCDTQDRTNRGMRELYNTHTHDGVQTGGGNTGDPNQQM